MSLHQIERRVEWRQRLVAPEEHDANIQRVASDQRWRHVERAARGVSHAGNLGCKESELVFILAVVADPKRGPVFTLAGNIHAALDVRFIHSTLKVQLEQIAELRVEASEHGLDCERTRAVA